MRRVVSFLPISITYTEPTNLSTMLLSLFGDQASRKVKRFRPLVDEINELESSIILLSDDELRSKTLSFKSSLSSCSSHDEQKKLLDLFLPEAFAIVREASKRVLGMRHFECS